MKQIQIVEKETEIQKKELKPTEIREFQTRRIEIAAKELTVNISGRKQPVKGMFMVSENIKNRQPLEIVITEGKVFQKSKNTLVIPSGTITISGVKEFEELKQFEKQEGDLQLLPIRDPDITEIDGRIFKQTGTLQVKVVDAEVNLIH